MLRPAGDWFWYLDQDSRHLAVSLGDEYNFLTALGPKRLTPFGNKTIPFDIEHLERYSHFGDAMHNVGLNLSAAQKTQIALNATACVFFHQPVNPKSWHFLTGEQGMATSHFHTLRTEESIASALILDVKNDLVTCLLLDGPVVLDTGKDLQPFSLVKVKADRLHPLTQTKQS